VRFLFEVFTIFPVGKKILIMADSVTKMAILMHSITSKALKADLMNRIEAVKLAGSRYCGRFTENNNYARGVGNYMVLKRRDGSVRFLILTKTPPSRDRTRLKNLADEIFEHQSSDHKYHKLGIMSKEERVFRNNMPMSHEHLDGPLYVKKDRMIWVEPYYATSKQEAKPAAYPGVNISLKEWCLKRFPRLSSDMIDYDIKTGKICVNMCIHDPEYIIKTSDLIVKCSHYHEKPILDRELEILHEDEDLVVVNKPASWPVHPCGMFRLNSVILMMHKLMKYKDIRTVHRLDRITSGVLILAKSTGAANKCHSMMISTNGVEKVYLALVHGKFPEKGFLFSSNLTKYNLKPNISVQFSAKHETISAETKFQLLAYDSENERSLLICQPVTGRTHQIRLHLKELGHPIVHDTLYGSTENIHYPLQFPKMDFESRVETKKFDYGNDESKETVVVPHKYCDKEIDKVNDEKPSNQNKILNFVSNESDNKDEIDVDNQKYRQFLESKFSYADDCTICTGEFVLSADEPLYICLHSYRYRLGNQEFTSSIPDWAKHLTTQQHLNNILQHMQYPNEQEKTY